MPKSYDVSTSRYTLKFNGPASEQEYDQAAGKLGSLLEEGVMSTAWRSTLPEFWSVFIPKVEAFTGIARGVDDVATAKAQARAKDQSKKVNDVPEKFLSYDNRVWAAANDETKAALIALAQETANSITIDPSPSRRQSGPGAANLAKADSWLTLDSDQLESKIEKAMAVVGTFDLERGENGQPTRESLGGLIKAYVDVLTA